MDIRPILGRAGELPRGGMRHGTEGKLADTGTGPSNRTMHLPRQAEQGAEQGADCHSRIELTAHCTHDVA